MSIKWQKLQNNSTEVHFFKNMNSILKKFETHWANTSTLNIQMNSNGSLRTQMYSCYQFH